MQNSNIHVLFLQYLTEPQRKRFGAFPLAGGGCVWNLGRAVTVALFELQPMYSTVAKFLECAPSCVFAVHSNG